MKLKSWFLCLLTCTLKHIEKHNTDLGSFIKGLTTECSFEFANIILLGTALICIFVAQWHRLKVSLQAMVCRKFLIATSGQIREKMFHCPRY